MAKFSKYIFLIVILSIVFIPVITKSGKMDLKVTSIAFKEGDTIPMKHTCEGENFSPQISWSNFPETTKSFALIADDPDAPFGTWVHWIVYNIPPNVHELKDKYPKESKFPDGVMQGTTDFGKTGYGGPCPPSGTHRYFYKVYALDTILDIKPGLTKNELLQEMDGHILAQGQLMGVYKKKFGK